MLSFAAPAAATCHCHRTIAGTELPAAACDAACPQQPTLSCGSLRTGTADSMYDVGHTRPAPVEQLTASNATNTTVTLAWRHADDDAEAAPVRSYRVAATIVRSNANVSLADEPPVAAEWIVPADRTHIELTSLRPWTVYNFTVRPVTDADADANDDADDHTERHTLGTTAIGWPEPEPPQPLVLGTTDRMRTVQLPVVRNTMGPVTRVRVVVVFEDASLVRRDFEASRVVGYAQSLEDGTNYYVTAELEPYGKARPFYVGDGRTYGGYVNEPLPLGAHVHVLLGVVSTEGAQTLVRYSRSSHDQHGGAGGAEEPMPDASTTGGGADGE